MLNRAFAHQLLGLTDVKSFSDFVCYSTSDTGRTLSDHFRFDISSFVPTSDGEDGLNPSNTVHCLPCSLCNSSGIPSSSSATTLCCIGECVVQYQIRATVIAGAAEVAATANKIDIIPTLEPRPPISTEDFAGEYLTYSQVDLRSSILQRWLGTLSLRSQEPSPLEFDPTTRVAWSKMMLRLCYRGRLSDDLPRGPPVAQARIQTRLKAVTFISVVMQKRQPTESEAITSPFTKRVTRDRGPLESWTVQFSPWRALGCHSSSCKQSKESGGSIPLICCRDRRCR